MFNIKILYKNEYKIEVYKNKKIFIIYFFVEDENLCKQYASFLQNNFMH